MTFQVRDVLKEILGDRLKIVDPDALHKIASTSPEALLVIAMYTASRPSYHMYIAGGGVEKYSVEGTRYVDTPAIYVKDMGATQHMRLSGFSINFMGNTPFIATNMYNMFGPPTRPAPILLLDLELFRLPMTSFISHLVLGYPPRATFERLGIEDLYDSYVSDLVDLLSDIIGELLNMGYTPRICEYMCYRAPSILPGLVTVNDVYRSLTCVGGDRALFIVPPRSVVTYVVDERKPRVYVYNTVRDTLKVLMFSPLVKDDAFRSYLRRIVENPFVARYGRFGGEVTYRVRNVSRKPIGNREFLESYGEEIEEVLNFARKMLGEELPWRACEK